MYHFKTMREENNAMKAKLLISLVLIAVLVSACGGGNAPFPGKAEAPTNVPTAIIVPINQETAAPTLEVVPTQKPASSCAEYGTEEFDTPNECWDLSKVFEIVTKGLSIPPEAAKITLDGGALNFEFAYDQSTLKHDLYYYFFNDANQYADVVLEEEVQALKGSKVNHAFSLACRVNDVGWYEARVTTNGLFWIYQYDRQLAMADKNPFVEIAKGNTVKMYPKVEIMNKLRMECVGDTITLKVNDAKVWSGQIRRPQPGSVGIGFNTFPGSYPVYAMIERVTISKP
jgi:hypothetical protein